MGWIFTFAAAASNLLRLPSLVAMPAAVGGADLRLADSFRSATSPESAATMRYIRRTRAVTKRMQAANGLLQRLGGR